MRQIRNIVSRSIQISCRSRLNQRSASMYTQLAEIPVPTGAQFIGPDIIRLSVSVRDHVRNEKRAMSKLISTKDTSTVPYQDLGNIVAHAVSPSFKHRALLTEVKNQGDAKRYVEIWTGDRREISMEVTNEHGAFYADDIFSTLAFSPNETSLLYTAEGKLPVSDDPYARFRFAPQLGEGFATKKRPTTYLFSWGGSETKTTVKALGASVQFSVLFGQAVFSPHAEDKVYATGYEYMPDGRLLGVKGCYNRPSGIWELTIPPVDTTEKSEDSAGTVTCTARKLTPGHLSCRSPRIRDSTLFWISSPTGGAHASTSSLHSLDLSSTSQSRTVVDLIFDSAKGAFPGLYPVGFNLSLVPFVRFSKSSEYIITESIWGSRSTVILISLADGSVKELTPDVDQKLYSWSVFGTDGATRVICARSTTNVPPEIVLGDFNDEGEVTWRVIDKPTLSPEVETALSRLRTSIVPIPGHSPAETVLVQLTDNEKSNTIPPCVTMPHGGPHTTTTTAFSTIITATALEGYTISSPNYTGSLGYGESYVRALLGNCGTRDIQDCIATVRHLISLGISEEGPGKQFLIGGSHGGFIIGHLIGQFPDMFSAAVLRNPILSAGETSISDLTDWFFSEFALPFPLASSEPSSDSAPPVASSAGPIPVMTPEAYSKLYAASPIAHVDAIRVPVLFLIGSADLRAAPTQGIGFYHALKRRPGSKVELLLFEGESHPLEGVETTKVSFETWRDWLAEARKTEA